MDNRGDDATVGRRGSMQVPPTVTPLKPSLRSETGDEVSGGIGYTSHGQHVRSEYVQVGSPPLSEAGGAGGGRRWPAAAAKQFTKLKADPRVQTAFNAAKQTVARGTAAFAQLSSDVNRDERSNVHSALQASQFNILDVYSSDTNELDLTHELQRVESQERRMRAELEAADDRTTTCCQRLLLRTRQRFFTFTSAPSSWIFLIALGFLAAVVAYLVDAPVAALQQVRYDAIASTSAATGYFVWVAWCVAFTLVAGLLGHLSPLSEGSGIPQMKSILAGTSLGQYLSFRVALAKLVGLVAAQAAGLSIGKEGPFVHIACALASKMWGLPYFFHSIGRNESLRRQMLAAAVAAGVTGVFGTPVGGVLFSVEVTSTYFLTSSYWRCFLCAIVCRFAFDIITTLKADSTLSGTNFPGGDLSAEVIAFALLGAICGLMGSLTVYTVNKLRIARKLLMTTPLRRYAILSVVAIAVASLTYATSYLRQSDKQTIMDLFADEKSSGSGKDDMEEWKSPSVIFSLIVFICIKFIVTVASISLPLACGLFIPLFVLGAATGRLFGELLHIISPAITPGAYAVVGAAALVSGATHTVSTAVIVFELTGQTSYLLPVLLASTVAYSVAGIFTISMYDMLLTLAGLPYLPRVYSSDIYHLTARDIMHSDQHYLTLASTYEEARVLLAAAPHSTLSQGTVFGAKTLQFPVVSSHEDMLLVGTVSRASVEALFRAAQAVHAAPTPVNTGAVQVVATAGAGGGDIEGVAAVEGAQPQRNQARPLAGGATTQSKAAAFVNKLLVVQPHPSTTTSVESSYSSFEDRYEDSDTPAAAAARGGAPRTHTSPNRAHTPHDRATPQATPTASADSMHTLRRYLFGGDTEAGEANYDPAWLNSRITFAGLPDDVLSSLSHDQQLGMARSAPLQTPLSGTSTGAGTTGAVSASPRPLALRVDPAPFQVSVHTPLPKLHFLFAICLFSHIYVTEKGRLVGLIMKDDLSSATSLGRRWGSVGGSSGAGEERGGEHSDGTALLMRAEH